MVRLQMTLPRVAFPIVDRNAILIAVDHGVHNVHAKHTSNSGFDHRTFMPCSGYFYSLPNIEWGGLTNLSESVGLPMRLI